MDQKAIIQNEKNYEIIKYLIEIKGDVNLKGKKEIKYLKFFFFLKTLFSKKIDMLGHSPFFNALKTRNSSPQLIELLISSKADANLTNHITKRFSFHFILIFFYFLFFLLFHFFYFIFFFF
jgi:hypothetical protein